MFKTRQHIGYTTFIACIMLRSVTSFAVTAEAAPLPAPVIQPDIKVIVPGEKDSLITLEAKQAPLGKIFNEISAKTGAIIHYSVLPEAPVTATCAGATIWQLMDCVAAKHIGLVTNKPEPNKPAEFWVLSSSVGSCPEATINTAQTTTQENARTSVDINTIAKTNQDHADQLIAALKQAKTPEERTQALHNLSVMGDLKDPTVRLAIEDALKDKQPALRVDALNVLAKADGEGATPMLQEALRDNDPTVRSAVVDNATNNRDVLEEAVHDSDPSVQVYATMKLRQMDAWEARHAK